MTWPLSSGVLGWYRINCKPEPPYAKSAVMKLMLMVERYPTSHVHFYGYDEEDHWTFAVVLTE